MLSVFSEYWGGVSADVERVGGKSLGRAACCITVTF